MTLYDTIIKKNKNMNNISNSTCGAVLRLFRHSGPFTIQRSRSLCSPFKTRVILHHVTMTTGFGFKTNLTFKNTPSSLKVLPPVPPVMAAAASRLSSLQNPSFFQISTQFRLDKDGSSDFFGSSCFSFPPPLRH